MKISKTRLKQIIKEELNEADIPSPFSRHDRYENIADPRMKSILNAIDELQYHIKYTIVEELHDFHAQVESGEEIDLEEVRQLSQRLVEASEMAMDIHLADEP